MREKVLYIGTPAIYQNYKQGKNPSHWLYGAVEMEKDGYDVVWEQEKSGLLHDWRLVRLYQPDMVFIPNLNLHNHFLLLVFAAIGFYKIPIFAWLHHEPKEKKGQKAKMYRMLLSGCRHLFFLSEKTMQETVGHKLVDTNRCSVPGWGADSNFFLKVSHEDKGYFISTGKENRDFDILIEAFKRTGAPLKIMTAESHAGNEYGDLKEKCRNIKNIEVVITENSGSVYPQMLEAMAGAKALVCPLRHDKLDYCVGLSTIADAEGLRKPLIITYNPYHNKERLRNFHVVETVDDWCEAIHDILAKDNGVQPMSLYSMQAAYEKMKSFMFE